MEFIDCERNKPKNRKAAFLHEAGHLFGLCDQWHGGLHLCEHTTDPVKESVMGSLRYDSLQPDDIAGIRILRDVRSK